MEEGRKRLTVGITLGDYNGIGPEVMLKTLQDERIFSFCNVVLYGSRFVVSFYARLLKIQNFNTQELTDWEKLNPRILNVVNCWKDQIQIEPGTVSEDAGAKALLCLEQAAADWTAGRLDVLLTAPVNKSTIASQLPGFTGQTEYLQQKAGKDSSLMLLCDEQLRVGLVTNHVSLKDVSGKIDGPLVAAKVELLNQTLREDFLISRPKIAVLGLNPHAGDENLIGREERDILAPVVSRLKDRGLIVTGPYPADGFFGAHHYRHFDAVLAMYHDQGLVPFKTLSFGSGVNYTAGIGLVRTSPDHGTGYDIAGKDMASPDSFRTALFTGLQIARNKAQYAEMHANPVERVRIHGEDHH